MICQRCGSSNLGSAAQCSRCGAALSSPPGPGAVVPPPPPADAPPLSAPTPLGGAPVGQPLAPMTGGTTVTLPTAWLGHTLAALTLLSGLLALVSTVKTVVDVSLWKYRVGQIGWLAPIAALVVFGALAFGRHRGAVLACAGASISALALGYPEWIATPATIVAVLALLVSAAVVGLDPDVRRAVVPDPAAAVKRPERLVALGFTGITAVVALLRVGSYGDHPFRRYGVTWDAHIVIVLLLVAIVAVGLLARPGSRGVGLAAGAGALYALDALAMAVGALFIDGISLPKMLLRVVAALPVFAIAVWELLAPVRSRGAAPAAAATSLATADTPLATGGPLPAGAAPAVPVEALAGPGARLGANLIDSFLNLLPLAAIWIGIIVTAAGNEDGNSNGAPLVAGVIVGLLLSIVMLVVFITQWRRAQSPGKRALGLRVVHADTGQPAGLGQMALREIVLKGIVMYLFSLVTCGIGSIVAAAMVFSARRQTLWDRMARTLVVSTRSIAAPTTAPAPPAAFGVPAAPAMPAPPVVPPAPPMTPPGVPAFGGAVAPVSPQAMPMSGVATLLPDPPDDDDAGMTVRHVAAAAGSGPVARSVRLDDGRILAVSPTVLLGRNPQASADEVGPVQLVPVDDPDRQISKTHLAIGADGAAVWVEDRFSTNGVVVRTANGDQRVPPGTRLPLAPGAVVLFGARRIDVL